MKSGKIHQEEEEEEDEEFGTKKHATTSANNNKDGMNNGKANAMRSKHSVTEQRRRSKINERFQILRDLIPNSDQKRDTASFLLEVIQYVQFLNEKVQKYEGPYQPWDSEPTKLMPRRNSHWCGQSFAGQAAQGMLYGSGHHVSTFHGRLDESSSGVPMTVQTSHQIQMESDSIRDASFRSVDPQSELPNKALRMEMPVTNDGTLMIGQVSEVQSTECPNSAHALNHQDELAVEGGTISISSVYSQGLLNSLAQALESTAGVDLSQASISVQINLGKRANGGLAKDHGIAMPSSSNQPIGIFHDSETSEDLEKAHKRLKN